jgi:sugar phosphate isomerase/epimerase
LTAFLVQEFAMRYSRRDIGRLALTALPAVTILKQPFAAMAQAPGKPNSTVNGVNLGTITYSYRSMPDQSAEAILRYVLDSGISRIEFMGGPVEAYAGAPQAATGRGGGRRGQQPTSEQQTAQREAADRLRAWRTSVSMDRFKALRKMFNDAGVAIYAWKQLTPNMSDAEMEYVFNVAEALGCTHTTLELVDDAEQLRRIGQMAEKKKIYAAYHTHLQGSMTAFDQAFAVSKGNMANVDLGHFVAAGGDPVAFIKRFNGRISSVHLKDRTTPANGQRNLSWGEGDTPLKEILLTMKRDKHTYPAAIELEYQVPSGSDAVKETVKCLDFCKAVLANA